MTSHSDPLHRLCSIDNDLLFFNADEQQQHLGLMTSKERRQLQSMIKKVHQHIQKITNLQRTGSDPSSTTSSTHTPNGSSPQAHHQQQRQEQALAINDFYSQKQIKQLYTKLKVIKERYSVAMQEHQIRQLENDMERYQQLQVIHGISGRLDVSSQIYEELHHLKLSLTLLRREWKLDRIQDIVSTLAISSSSPSSPISSLLLAPPPSASSSNVTSKLSLSEQHSHRWYPLVNKKWSVPSSSSSSSLTKRNNNSSNSNRNYHGSGGFVGVMKNWFKHHTWNNRISKASETTAAAAAAATTTTSTMISTDNATSELEIRNTSSPKKRALGHYHFGQRSQPHLHLINCSSREECRLKIQQLIHDFYHVFEANARQNEQHMHQLYARVFQQDVDPMLAEDMQRLCLAVSAAPPPTLASLLQPGLSSAFGAFCATSDSMRDSFLITEHDADAFDDMIFLVTPPPPSSSSSSSSSLSSSSLSFSKKNHHQSSTTYRKHRKWIKAVWKKGGTTTSTTKQRQHNKQKQKQPQSPPPPSSSLSSSSSLSVSVESTDVMQHQQQQQQQQQQQVLWSICLGLISEHLLYMGLQFYTKWIREISQAQHQQTIPLQVATKTLASMYRALQIEQGYAILSRLCTQLESCVLLP